MLVGLLVPQSGEVKINNEIIDYNKKSDLRIVREKIGIVFQQYNLISKYGCFKKCLYSTN